MPYRTQNMVMNDWKSSTTKMDWKAETLDHCSNQKVIIFSFQLYQSSRVTMEWMITFTNVLHATYIQGYWD